MTSSHRPPCLERVTRSRHGGGLAWYFQVALRARDQRVPDAARGCIHKVETVCYR